MRASKEQRKNDRLSVNAEIEFLAPEPCQGRTVDVCAGGLGVELPIPLAKGDWVELKIFQGHLIVQGRVRWAQRGVHGYRAGIQFQEEDWNIISRVQAMSASC